MDYTFTTATNQPTPIGGDNLEGKYIPFDFLPRSVQTIIANPNYLVLVREQTTGALKTSGGGRTQGTLWHNQQVLAFTVEDAIRDKKIQDKTAIPDTIEDPSKFNGIPSNVYNISLRNTTGNKWIRASFYNGSGLVISSKSDNTSVPINIYEEDVYTDASFATDRKNLAFDGAFFHAGGSETASSGCIIVSNIRYEDGTIKSSHTPTQNLNKYLSKPEGLVGKGKRQQFAIINLWEIPPPPPIIQIPLLVINSETLDPPPKTKVEIIFEPIASTDEDSNNTSKIKDFFTNRNRTSNT